MRRFLSITLLGIFLFQLVGYYFVYVGLQYQANADMISRLDAQLYSSDETITLKIPFTLPYWSDSQKFERVNGDFEHQGQFYKLVKQKLSKDTLYVVCIKDVTHKRLFDSLTDFVKLSNDLPTSSKQTLKLWGNILKDYVAGASPQISSTNGWTLSNTFSSQTYHLLSVVTPISSPPPELLG